jgi:hypothetical protein
MSFSAGGVSKFTVPLLWLPQWRFQSAERPADPVLGSAWDLGRAHGRAGSSGFCAEQFEQVAAFDAAERHAYHVGRAIEIVEPRAPLPWPAATCLIAGETALRVLVERLHSFFELMPAERALSSVRAGLECERARALGLTGETAPQLNLDWSWSALTVAVMLVLQLRGRTAATPSWPVLLARAIVNELERRRAWERALDRLPRSQSEGLPGGAIRARSLRT